MNGIYVLKNPMSVPLKGKHYIINGYSIIGGIKYADAEVIKGNRRYDLRDDSWNLRKELGAVI